MNEMLVLRGIFSKTVHVCALICQIAGKGDITISLSLTLERSQKEPGSIVKLYNCECLYQNELN